MCAEGSCSEREIRCVFIIIKKQERKRSEMERVG